MNIEEFREYCLSKKGATEGFPFDDVTLVFKVMNKMFALTSLTGKLSFNLKCDPEKAIELREQHTAIIPGYHMNKKHWNTVYSDSSLSKKFIESMIDDSYQLIVQKLPSKLRYELSKL